MEATDEIRVYPLYLGSMYSDSNYTIMGDTAADAAHPNAPHRLIHTPSSAFLIKHPEAGCILYDTGMPDDPWAAWPQWMVDSMRIEKPEESKMANQLAKCDVAPEEVKYVVTSHMHMDHVGSDPLFANTADFIVSKADAQHAYCMVLGTTDDTKRGYYLKNEVLRERKSVTYLDRDTKDLFPGIDAYILPGHTPGILALLVHLQHGNDLFLVADAFPVRENYEGRLPGGAWDSAGFRESSVRVHQIAKENHAEVLFGHDERQFASLRKAPEYYC